MARKCKKNDKVVFNDEVYTVTAAVLKDKADRTYYELRNDEDRSETELVRTDRFIKLR